MLSTCIPSGPVASALTSCRNWIGYSPSQPHDPTRNLQPTEEQLTADLQRIFDEGWRGLYTYTLDSTFQEVPRIAKQIGFTHVIAGVFWFDDAQLAREKEAAVEEQSFIDAVVVGNEGLHEGRYSRAELVDQLEWFRDVIERPVTTSETGGQYLTDPTLLDLGDFAFPNIQPWFNAALDPHDPPGMAQAVADEYAALQRLRDDTTIVAKETWYPTGGHSAATEANQALFFEALAGLPVKFTWGEAHDQPWKTGESSPFGNLGPDWGLHEADGSPKQIIGELAHLYTGSYYRVDDVLGPAVTVLQRMHNAEVTGGFPLNEATGAELDELSNGQVPTRQTQFVPSQLGYWFLSVAGSHAYRKQQSEFTAGLNDDELRTELAATVSQLEMVFDEHAYFDEATGGRALFQRYDTLTGRPLIRDSFENAIPLIDNSQLAAGMQLMANYLSSLRQDEVTGSSVYQALQELAGRIEVLLRSFNFRMWYDGSNLRIGGRHPLGTDPAPATGSSFDRITTETRTSAVVARAFGDLSDEEFRQVLSGAVRNSRVGASPGGVLVERTPFAGTALEIAAATPLISSELGTLYAQGTLLPEVRARRDTVQQLGIENLTAFGATGVSTGSEFRRFGLSPIECTNCPDNDSRVLVPLASGMIAGALGKPPAAHLQRYGDRALRNFNNAIEHTAAAGKLHPVYGLPNAVDFGSGKVEAEPVWGFLEVAQMAAALLNHQLGGDFFERLLRNTAGWNRAMNQYWAQLNVREGEFQDDAAPGLRSCRENASGGTLPHNGMQTCDGATWHLERTGSVLSYPIAVSTPGNYEAVVTYSNDDAGSGDVIDVLLDGAKVASFETQNTGAWTSFVDSAPIDLGRLERGLLELSFQLRTTDGHGFDLDKFALHLTRINWQNPRNPLDVNNDGLVTPVGDVLRLLNELNSPKLIDAQGSLPALPYNPPPPPYFDVGGDNVVSPVDDLLPIINFFATQAGGQAEAEPSGSPPLVPATHHDNGLREVFASYHYSQPTSVPFGDHSPTAIPAARREDRATRQPAGAAPSIPAPDLFDQLASNTALAASRTAETARDRVLGSKDLLPADLLLTGQLQTTLELLLAPQ